MRGWRRVSIGVAVLAGAASVVLADPAAAGNVTMDGFIGKHAGGPFLGKELYNETGDGQTVTKTAAQGETRKFYARFANRTSFTSAASLTGTQSAPCFRVRYFDNVSGVPAELDPTINFVTVGPGFKTSLLRIEVKAKGCATPGSKYIVNLDVEPVAFTGEVDRVRAKLKVV